MATVNSLHLQTICDCLDNAREDIIALQRELTAIPALCPNSGGDGEDKKAAFLVTYLRDKLGCKDIEVIDAPDDRVSSGKRPNIVATFEGEDTSRTLWIMSHTDVVPADDPDKWESDPWQIRVDGDKIFGRGTEDNQQGIVSSLVMILAFLQTGTTPACNIGLIFVADEETGSEYGIQYLLKNRRDIFRDSDLILIPDAGNEDGTLLEVAEKSILWLRFKTLGKTTHGSTPELGINAFRAASNLVVRLDELYTVFDAVDNVFEPPTSTFEATKKEANVPNVNTIPGEDVFYMDCRILPQYRLESVHEQIREICRQIEQEHRVTIELEVAQEQQAAPPTPVDSAVVRAVQHALSEIHQIETEPKGIGGGTVAAFFRAAGMHAVVWATQDETLHEANEYVRISNIIADAKVFAHVALQKV